MKTSVKYDLEDARECLENLERKLKQNKLTFAEQIDVAARLKAIAKHCKTIDETVKAGIKVKRNGKAGEVLGELFKAILRIDTSSRFNQSRFKADDPKTFDAYCESCSTEVVTFEPR